MPLRTRQTRLRRAPLEPEAAQAASTLQCPLLRAPRPEAALPLSAEVVWKVLRLRWLSCRCLVQADLSALCIRGPAGGRRWRLDRPTWQLCVEVLGQAIAPSDGQKLSLEALTEDAGLLITRGSRDGAAPERAVDVDRSAGDDLRSRPHRPDHRHIDVPELDCLAGANRRGNDQGGRSRYLPLRSAAYPRLARLGPSVLINEIWYKSLSRTGSADLEASD